MPIDTNVTALNLDDYKYGFKDPDNYVFKSEKGLSRKVVEMISSMKEEPEWMLKFRLKALDWDGQSDSIYHPFDLDGRRHMEYLAYRGVYADIPFETIRAAFRHYYPKMYRADGDSTLHGDFAAEGAAEAAGR